MNNPNTKPDTGCRGDHMTPEDFGPREPEIVRITRHLRRASAAILPTAHTLDGILSPYEPWCGSCGFLLCLTSLYMYAERGRGGRNYYDDRTTLDDFNDNFGNSEDDATMADLNRERIYKVLLTASGMGLVNHYDKSGAQHMNYEVTPGYLDRAMRFLGYTWEALPPENAEELMLSVRLSIGAETGIPVLAQYRDGWALIVGYDTARNMFVLRKGAQNEERENDLSDLVRLVIVTDTNGTSAASADWKSFVRDIISVMETDAPGLGMQGYRNVIAALRDDAFFENMTAEQSLNFGNTLVWGWFISHSEARGFSGQGFEWRFLNRYPEANRLAELWCQLSYYGDQHHQIGWCGYNIFTAAGNDIRPRSVREKMICAVYHIIDNDRIMCRILKQIIGLDTPDVLCVGDPETGEIFDTQIRAREEEVSHDEMMAGIRIHGTRDIDLTKELVPIGGTEPAYENGRLMFTGNNGIDDLAGMQLKTPISVPFLVRMRMKTTRHNVHIYFGDGCITFRKHPHTSDSLYIRDNAIGLYYGYDQRGEEPADTFFDLEWLVTETRFVVAVDGEVRHYGENYPYMKMPSLGTDVFRFGTADGNTLTVESLSVSEVGEVEETAQTEN